NTALQPVSLQVLLKSNPTFRRASRQLPDGQCPRSEPTLEQSLLNGSWWFQPNALQCQHAGLRFQTARRRKAAQLPIRRQDPVAWDDQGDRVFRHRLSHVARRLGASSELFGQRAIRGGMSPFNPASCLVDSLVERLLAAQVECDIRKINL